MERGIDPRALTLVAFERKDRVQRSLEIARRILGNREFCIARELTKDYEEFILGMLEDEDTYAGLELLGEVTLVIGPPGAPVRTPDDEVLAVAARERGAGGKPREVARRVSESVTGWSPGEVYELMLGDKR